MAALVCAALAVAITPVDALASMQTLDGASTVSQVAEWISQSFYHTLLLPMLLLTIIMAWLARPSTTDERPFGFSRFQVFFLTVWSLCVCADWLQGPYVYALYAAYGFSKSEIAELFVAGFGASLVFGCVVGAIADRFGRKKTCIAYCALYIASCLTKHFKSYSILMLGRVTGGIATSMLFSCFECWMVAEHVQRKKFSSGLLGYMFGLMFTTMYCVAIFSGLAAQGVADAFTFHPISSDGGLSSLVYVGGCIVPFDLAIIVLVVGMVLIALMWEENYGSVSAEDVKDVDGGFMENIRTSMRLLFKDPRVLMMCIMVAGFEGSMFAFVFNWTPALRSSTVPPPYGVIFALFMMACMCGSSASTIASSATRPHHRLVLTFTLGMIAFFVAAGAPSGDQSPKVSFAAFLIIEFCIGVYFPSIGILKSGIVPESVRGTIYNIYRIPLNGVVVLLLLVDMSMASCFRFCGLLLLLCLFAVQRIMATQAELTPLCRVMEETCKEV